MGGIKALFGLRFEIEGLDQAAPGPIVMMMRHASIIDNVLPDYTVTAAHGIGLRFVLKRELQIIPTIDIGGRWVPTVYVRRASTDPEGEITVLATLADDLGPGEGILIYPEGTRATAKKIARAQEVIAERQPEISPMANRLHNLLPPRLGGPLALLGRAKGVDVVFCGHVGFDGFQYISDIWAGGLVGRTIRVRFWRCPADSIPADEAARTRWLYEGWQRVDDWIGEHRRGDAAERRALD
jgi:1-acyl-sn-glycerol-3-phosphate acyltransferase